MNEHDKGLSLSERIQKRAQTQPPDKSAPVICKIIEARSVITQEHLRGQSWLALAGILKEEGVHLSSDTLRNYMAQIGKAEAALQKAGTPAPTDEEIHAALPRVRTKKPVAPDPISHPLPQVATAASTPDASRPAAAPQRSPFIRNPDREL